MTRTAAALLCLLLIAPAIAQATFDDDLFGGDTLVTEVDENEEANPADELLESERIVLGGRFSVSVRADLNLHAGEDAVTSGLANLSTRLFLDARPTSDFRFLLKGDANYSSEEGLDFTLREMFADIDILDTVFLRAGKQTINWGVGPFFSPANLVNLERIDPENPEEELTGPVALKGQLPIDTSNLTGYLLLNDIGRDENIGVAARYEFLVGNSELTVGGIYDFGSPWALMATATGSIEDVTVFAEAVLQGNSDKVFVVEDPRSRAGFRITTSDSLFFSGTIGGRFSYTTEDDLYSVSAAAQYLFNGLGYADPSLFTDDPAALAFAQQQIALGNMSPSDLLERGQHNAAARVSSNDIANTDLTPSVLWLSNLSDGSGLVSAGVRYDGIDFVTLGLDYRYLYGPDGAEYRVAGASHTLSLSVTVSGSF